MDTQKRKEKQNTPKGSEKIGQWRERRLKVTNRDLSLYVILLSACLYFRVLKIFLLSVLLLFSVFVGVSLRIYLNFVIYVVLLRIIEKILGEKNPQRICEVNQTASTSRQFSFPTCFLLLLTSASYVFCILIQVFFVFAFMIFFCFQQQKRIHRTLKTLT